MGKYHEKLKDLLEVWFSQRKVLTEKDYKMLKDLCNEVLK